MAGAALIQLLLQVPGQASKRLSITRFPYTIGSDSGCNLTLRHGEILPEHLKIDMLQGQPQWVPSGPTQVNGATIQGPTVLQASDRVKIGPVQLRLQSVEVNTSATPPPPKSERPAPLQDHELLKSLHKGLLENLDLKRMDLSQTSDGEIRRQSETILQRLVSEVPRHRLGDNSLERWIQMVIDQALGLGPLEDLLKDAEVTEIMVNNADNIFVERSGKLSLSGYRFIDNQQVIDVIRRIIAPIGRRIDESSPMVDARLADGSRVNAIIPPLAVSGPSITIRRFATEPFRMDDLIGFDTLTPNMAKFLKVCVEQRKNICISGGTGSGKTTLLGVVSGFIPEGERIITIEDAAELRLPQEHIVSLESKPPNLEGKGAIPIRKLVINSLRMRPDRIVVGECRGAEALDMLQAMNTGHDGSLTTLHANTCRDAISRLETMVLMAGTNLPSRAIIEQVASAVDVIVQTTRYPDGTRKITSISVVDGMEGEKITLHEVFAHKTRGYDTEGKVLGSFVCEGGVPAFYKDLQERGVNVDLGLLQS